MSKYKRFDESSGQPPTYATQQPAGGYPPQGGYPGQPPYQGGPPPGGAYGGPPPQAAAYQGPQPPQSGYPGGPPPPGQGAPPPSNIPQYQGEMPADDIDDNPNAPETLPTAPPVEKMDTINGYNNVGFDSAFLPPPSYDDAMKNTGPPQERQNIQNVPTVTEQEAREALLQYISEHCCYGKRAAEDLKYMDLKSTSAFHYTLETFGEGRMTSWAYEPYRSQPIDGPQNGPAPGPWDILAQPGTMFQDAKQEFEVPHTASVKPCHGCFASGYVRCHRCLGRGRIRCNFCNGSGHRMVFRDGGHHREHCPFCHGLGRNTCYTCHGFGMVECKTCQAQRNLKCYIKLTVTWTNHLNDHIVERTPLPDHLIRSVTGQVAFEETNPKVWPINHFHEREINDASNRLITSHQFPSERMLMQRHRVRIVPVTQCIYKWKDIDSDYFVYGFEHTVYAPNYPQQCCCGCVLL